MREPAISQQAFIYRANQGFHFVEYPDGEVSGLMSRADAANYASIFGGKVRKHSQAPKSRFWRTVKLLVLASCLIFGLATAAHGFDRGDKLIIMVLQEAENQPLAGMVAVAGVALDRVKDDRWPNTLKRVIYQPKQFDGMAQNLRRYSAKSIKYAVVAVEIARTGTRPCGTVLWFHTDDIKPDWASHADKRVRCQIGDHIFYEDAR